MIAVYLGAGGLPQGQVQVNSAVSSVAQICAGISGKVLDKIRASKECQQTSEQFLKAVLRHYKVGSSVANKQLLLHARAKLYYRMGRLLQNWPNTQVHGLNGKGVLSLGGLLVLVACPLGGLYLCF